MLQNPEVKTEYERLQPEFALLHARLEAGKTQDGTLLYPIKQSLLYKGVIKKCQNINI